MCVICFAQMMLYLSFPVTMFWISNQAEYFEEYIVKRKVRNLFLRYVYRSSVDNYSCSNNFCHVVYFCGMQREIFPPDEESQVRKMDASQLRSTKVKGCIFQHQVPLGITHSAGWKKTTLIVEFSNLQNLSGEKEHFVLMSVRILLCLCGVFHLYKDCML